LKTLLEYNDKEWMIYTHQNFEFSVEKTSDDILVPVNLNTIIQAFSMFSEKEAI